MPWFHLLMRNTAHAKGQKTEIEKDQMEGKTNERLFRTEKIWSARKTDCGFEPRQLLSPVIENLSTEV